jgi:hypothetical protein
MAVRFKTSQTPAGYLLVGKVFPQSIYDKIASYATYEDTEKACFNSTSLEALIESNSIQLNEEERKIMMFLFNEMDEIVLRFS